LRPSKASRRQWCAADRDDLVACIKHPIGDVAGQRFALRIEAHRARDFLRAGIMPAKRAASLSGGAVIGPRGACVWSAVVAGKGKQRRCRARCSWSDLRKFDDATRLLPRSGASRAWVVEILRMSLKYSKNS